jgi:hypothetical protein
MNWRKAIARVLVVAFLVSALAPSLAAPIKGTDPPPVVSGNDCGRTGVSGSTPYCPPSTPTKPVIVAPTPPGGWQTK